MKYFIITGTSRGLGEHIVRNLIHEEHCLFCLSRSENYVLMEEAREASCPLYYITCDLNQVTGLTEIMDDLFKKIIPQNCTALYLVNNAGIVGPISPIHKCKDTDLIQNIHVNLLAPMILTSAFVSHGKAIDKKMRVFNVSSGAGRKPLFGWGAYCSSKAGLDLFSRVGQLEAMEQDEKVEYMSFAPGIIDTDMQAQIRSSAKEDFSQVDRFIDFKESGVLLPPEKVAKLVAKVLLQDNWDENPIIDIRDCFNKM